MSHQSTDAFTHRSIKSTPATSPSLSPEVDLPPRYTVLMIAPTSFFADYGCHVRILEETRILQAMGHRVTIVAYHNGKDVPGIEIQRTLPIPWRSHYEVGSSRHKIAFDLLLGIKTFALLFRRWVRRDQYDVIHAHLHEGALLAHILGKLFGVPVVFDFQGSLTEEMIDHKFISRTSFFYRPLRRLEEWIDRTSRVIFTSSTEARRILLQQFQCEEDRVRALPDCVNAETFTPAAKQDQAMLARLRQELAIPAEAKIIVYLGLLAPYQGTDLLLEAMQRILQVNSNVYLLLMGFPGIDIYRHQAETLGILDHVRLTGRIPYQEAPHYLALGDVAVAPKLSVTESAGKLLNYMGVGLPTVAFDTPVAREYLGPDGLLARRGDQAELAEMLLQAINTPERGDRLRQRAIDNFSWTQAGEAIVAAYTELKGIQKLNRQEFPKPRPLFGLFSVLFALLVLSNFALYQSSRPLYAASMDTTMPNERVPVQTQIALPSYHDWQFSWGTIPSPTIFLPYIAQLAVQLNPMPLSERIGFGLTSASLAPYTDVATLGAGWYLDWRVRETPEQPADMSYVQVVRVHQKLACGQRYHSDRTACPYAEPLDYIFAPGQAAIEAAARANPGSIWFIGNEMDRIDWAYCVKWNGAHCDVVGYDGQDEILPETYAVAYHDLYAIIKTADPTAQLGIGGVIQPTPLRLEYLTMIWDQYQTLYTDTMPVDVWNIHNFIIQEVAHSWGTDIPPGIDAVEGEYVDNPSTHIDMTIFKKQIVAFREWMKERGQQQKPLVVSEYGVLFHNGLINGAWASNDPSHVQSFMIDTFDYFATAKDCNLGYLADGCRLVQRWNWYSLDDVWGTFNPHSRLFDPETGKITATGLRFQAYLAEEH